MKLQTIQKYFEKSYGDLQKQLEPLLLKIDRAYVNELDQLIKELTRAGSIEDAVKVRQTKDNFIEDFKVARTSKNPPPASPIGAIQSIDETRLADTSIPDGLVLVTSGRLPEGPWVGAQAVDAFFIAKTEVTWAEFQTVRTWAAANGYDIGSVGAGTGPNRPVTNVSWYHVVKWCNARSEKEGLTPVYRVDSAIYRTGDSVPTINPTANGYRLPSEKEWEFAARGGVKTNGYEYSGSNDVNAVAWYSSNSSNSTQDVATKLANELGLSDMSGNVREWCFDASGTLRVGRGGSWLYSAINCRVAVRSSRDPASTGDSFGFRVARSSVP